MMDPENFLPGGSAGQPAAKSRLLQLRDDLQHRLLMEQKRQLQLIQNARHILDKERRRSQKNYEHSPRSATTHGSMISSPRRFSATRHSIHGQDVVERNVPVRELLAQRRSQQVKQNLNGHQALPPIKPDGHDARIEISQKDNPTDVRRTCGRENLSRERVSQSEIFPENQVVLDTSSATPNERYARTSQTPTDNHEDEDDEHVSATNHSKNLLRTAPRSGSSRRGSSSWQQKEEQRKAKEEERKQQIAMRKQRRDEMHRQRMAQRAAEKEAAEHGEDAVGADDINGSREHSGTVDDHSFASSRHDNRHSDSTHNVKSTGRRVVINDDERLQEHDDFGARESDTDNALEETTVSDQHIQSGHRSNVQSSQRSPSHSERSFTEPHEYHGLESDADPPSETDGFNDAYGVNNSAHKQQLQHVNSNHVEEHEIQPTPPRQQGPKPPTTPRGSAATKSARRNLVRKPAQTGVTHGNNADRREADMDQHMPASPAAHADEAPLSPAQHNAQGDSMSAMFAEAATMEGAHVQVQLKPCSICGRKFASERLQKHMDVCKKASTSKRKTFDQSKARLQGTEAAQFAKNADITEKQYSKKLKKANWKAQSEAFRAAMRAAKNPNAGPAPALDTSDLVPCEFCGRTFSDAAAERHIPRCKEKNGGARSTAPAKGRKPKKYDPRSALRK